MAPTSSEKMIVSSSPVKSNDTKSLSSSSRLWKTTGAVIQEGDLVILYEGYSSIQYAYMKKGEIFQDRYGQFHHDDMIGQKFGLKLQSRGKSTGYIHVLAPTVELWTKALRHRTQIIYIPDASQILFQLEVTPGSVIIEAGTGSGSLSSAFMRAIAPTGHLYTFEFNSYRAVAAREDFKANGLESLVTVTHQDVCSDAGFRAIRAGSESSTTTEELVNIADGLFLDLPCPWKAIPAAKRALKPKGIFASYSPCIEQVQETCVALRAAGFDMIRTIETRLIPYDLRHVEMPMPTFKPYEREGKRKVVQSGGGNCDDTRVFAKKDDEMRGHTAYLTFANKFASA